MENRTFYNEILTDHNLHPLHKEKLPDANLVLEGFILRPMFVGNKFMNN